LVSLRCPSGGGKAEFVPNPGSLVTVELTVTYDAGFEFLASPRLDNHVESEVWFDGFCRRDRDVSRDDRGAKRLFEVCFSKACEFRHKLL